MRFSISPCTTRFSSTRDIRRSCASKPRSSSSLVMSLPPYRRRSLGRGHPRKAAHQFRRRALVKLFGILKACDGFNSFALRCSSAGQHLHDVDPAAQLSYGLMVEPSLEGSPAVVESELTILRNPIASCDLLNP